MTVLASVAWKIEPLLSQALAGPADVADDLASLAKHLVLFAAILVAHRGLEALIEPSLATVELAWMYDPVFLGLALVSTTVVVIRMLGNLGEVTALITARLSNSSAAGTTESTGSSPSDGQDG